jgi:hypothetical protein
LRQKTGSEALGGNQSASAGDSLTIKDNRLLNPDPPILEIIPYNETSTVDRLLDRIRNSLKSPPKPHTYGREWILYDPKGGEYFHKIGTRWAQFIENKQLDESPLTRVGIIPGMTLEVRPPKQRIVVINLRPLVGGGEEALLLEYFDLKTVGGLLNRIQNSIPQLSAESYGTKWILYDPASGHYFDDIAKRDSRVLEAVGIATGDGDTFLDVRPPAIVNPESGQNLWQWWTGLKTELKVAVIAGLFTIVVAIVTGIFNLGVAIYNGSKASPTQTPALAATSTPTSTPDVPEPKTATVYRNASGTLFIEAEYDPPLLRRGETLSLEASTRESFDDVPRLLLPSEIESVSAGKTHGRLSCDSGDQPVWYRFLITDAQGKRWYGKSAIAKRR